MKLSGKRTENGHNSGKRKHRRSNTLRFKYRAYGKGDFVICLFLRKKGGFKLIEPLFIVTNNPMSKEKFQNSYKVIYIDGPAMDVLKRVRDFIHIGHRILTHPLMGSVKPNETPYRTVCISKEKLEGLDFQSLEIIENSIITTEKFLKDFRTPSWSEKILLDFQLIDSDLIDHAIN